MTITMSKTDELLALRQSEVPRGVSGAHPVVAAKAQGSKLWDTEGREYHDWVGGIGVLNVGHNHPAVIEAVKGQLENFCHTSFQVTMYEPYLRLAQRLNALFPGEGKAKTIFLTTGVEATENAVKIARSYTGRPAIISFTHSFHGRTLMGMSLTGKKSYYSQNFGPFAPDIYHAPIPYEYRGVNTEQALAGLDELLRTAVDASRVAAIIIEPVLGEGGFLPVPKEFMQALRQRCDQHGILLIADEIQAGVGRTGRFWSVEHSGVKPDLLCFAKSIGGGLPLSGVTGRAEIMDAPQTGGLGGTYAGSPLACAAGLAVLDLFADGSLLAQANAVGEQLRTAFSALQQQVPGLGDVRGLGPMIAVEFVKDPQTREPDPETAKKVIELARQNGLLLLGAGMYGSVIRVLVPINVTDKDLQDGIAIFTRAVQAAAGK